MAYSPCQSCSMPLTDTNHGTEKNGSKSDIYCNLCYKDGAFITPDMTLEQMKTVVDTALKEKGWWAPMRWMAVMVVPTLTRWKK